MKHELKDQADCWCEPRVIHVYKQDGTFDHDVYVHSCNTCEHNPCICAENIIEGGE